MWILRVRAALAWIGVAVGLFFVALAVYHGSLRTPLSSDARFLTYQNEFVRDSGGLSRAWTADYFEGAITHGVEYRSGATIVPSRTCSSGSSTASPADAMHFTT